MDLGHFVLYPGEERRAEVEADLRIVADNARDVPLAVHDSRGGVRRVTLGGDALVPVVVRVGGILEFHPFQPGILPWWLIEVAVNAQIFFHIYTLFAHGL